MSIMTEKKLYINCTHQYVPDEKYKTVFSECKQVFFFLILRKSVKSQQETFT